MAQAKGTLIDLNRCWRVTKKEMVQKKKGHSQDHWCLKIGHSQRRTAGAKEKCYSYRGKHGAAELGQRNIKF